MRGVASLLGVMSVLSLFALIGALLNLYLAQEQCVRAAWWLGGSALAVVAFGRDAVRGVASLSGVLSVLSLLALLGALLNLYLAQEQCVRAAWWLAGSALALVVLGMGSASVLIEKKLRIVS